MAFPRAREAPTQIPGGVGVLAVFLLFSGVVGVLLALNILLGFRFPVGGTQWERLGTMGGVLLLVYSAATLFAARGVWRGYRWAWYAGLALLLVSLLTNAPRAVASLQPVALLSAALTGLASWYLLTPRIQAWFDVAHPMPWHRKRAAG